ncbi:hypothetical protein FC83_GL000612 [Agrilactobacillus composti DSM 18527 = JCM 14202]|jgi:hypothetical protein|uniref:Regulator of the mannose operon, ManO n=1 Tax=Agrilactobacillus composti DSM 18527 = JCM 14202 TaxID=1423734 RepID=X0PDZ8_9LACO|nr:DUF956 family protein [Agrilactobacillus composti]KRM31551.1 hypothetical protein FC83_GL000612 [Agrilactobacillus composti DSM 18527 = JCM 14202]MCH4172411.1 DUF956 family protein [Lactobacillus sp.]GAF39428.1 putative regulator of the mannose operon, ManO [Agrilactobacillus composti DSM 18527 = JCM 14202]
MVQSINTKADLVVNATAYLGLPDYGKIMIGDKGFEFFNDRDASRFVQIPWNEMNYVIVSIILKGKWIPRYAIQTKRNGTYTFASKDPKRVLREIRKHIPADHIVRSLSFFDVIKRAITQPRRRNKNKSKKS